MALSLQGILTPEALAAFPGLQAAVNRQIQNVGKVRNEKGEYVTPESILGRATYSWASPEALGQAPGSFDYQNIPYSGNFGVGIANLGVNESNIISRIDLARQRHRQNDKSGGHREIYKHMKDWGEKNNPGLVKYLETGELPDKGVSMDTLLQAYDYGARALGQKQQTKETFFENPFVRAGLAAAAGALTGNVALGAELGTAATTASKLAASDLTNRATAPKRQQQKGLQPTGSTPNVTRSVSDVLNQTPQVLTTTTANRNNPLTNVLGFMPKDYAARGTYSRIDKFTEEPETNPYNLTADTMGKLTAIAQLFPREYTERSVTDAALLPDNNIADRARETNLTEGFVDPGLDERNSKLFKNLLGMGLNMARNAQPTDPSFLTPPPVGGQRFQYNPYQFGSPQGMPISFLASRARGQMKTPFQYELEKLVRKV